VLATRKPSLRGALLAAMAAGYTHVILDSTLLKDAIEWKDPGGLVDQVW